MADLVLQYDVEPGYRLLTGSDLNQMIEAINKAFSEAVGSGEVGEPNGIATLDANGHVPASQLGLAVLKAGDTMTGPLIIDQNVQGIKTRLAMVLPGTQQDAPTSFGIASTYLGIGGGEWNVNSYRLIGFGYISSPGDQYPAVIGYEEIVKTDHTRGDLVFGTRPVNTNTAPTIILRVRNDGQILAEQAGYTPTQPKSLASKDYVDTKIPATEKGTANGVATLDASGKVPTSQINISGLDYQGTWNAATNTPALSNGTGTAGHFYKVSTAGSHDFGAGAIAFNVGDWVIYENAIWDRVGVHEAVASVNAKTGAVVLVAADVGAVAKAGDETVAGVKTFSSSPVVPTPTTAAQAAPKAYVDGLTAPKAPVAVSANKTLTRADHGIVHLVNASAGPVTLTIDGANVDPGNTFIVKDTDASANTITVQMNGGGTIDGGANYQIGANGFGTVIVQDATHAFVINNGIN